MSDAGAGSQDIQKKSVVAWILAKLFIDQMQILLYLGLLMFSISLAAAVVWVIAIGFLHYISRHEEKLLLAHFGEQYTHYMLEVPMWIPRLSKR